MRTLLYMASLTAITRNPDLALKYRQLRERVKPPKVALTAVMRRMLVLANVLVREAPLESGACVMMPPGKSAIRSAAITMP